MNNLITFLDTLNDLNWGGTEPYKVGVGVVSNSGSGLEYFAQEVRVGKLIDTQRRRRNALDEDYVTGSLA